RHVAAVQSLVQDLEASDCQVTIDGRDYSNRYLLMEVMNTSYVGPGLMLAPEADPGDEYFQVVLIASAEKNLLANYLADILQGANPENPFFRVTGKRVEFSCAGASLHVDDAYLHNGGHGKFTILANADP